METLIITSITGVLMMLAGATNRPKLSLIIAFIGLTVASIANVGFCFVEHNFANDMIINDLFSLRFNALILFLAFMTFLLYWSQCSREAKNTDEIAALLVFSTVGMLMMTSFGNLTTLFLGIEIMSLPLYVLAGSRKYDLASNEAAMKYFLMGSFATGIMLFGIALIYGQTASFDFHNITKYIANAHNHPSNVFIVGALLLSVGLLFKIAAIPFHFWAPDVYEGSPLLITTFMASVAKIASIATFYRLYYYHFGALRNNFAITIGLIAIMSFLIASLIATRQTRFKRLMAYSGIAHTGFMLLTILVLDKNSMDALFLYAVSYSVSIFTIFAILLILNPSENDDSLELVKGLAYKNKYLAVCLTIALLSLAGIPPFSGFMAKFYVFLPLAGNGFTSMLVLAILTSAIGIYYYLKPIRLAFSKDESSKSKIVVKPALIILLTLSLLITLTLGVMPGLLERVF